LRPWFRRNAVSLGLSTIRYRLVSSANNLIRYNSQHHRLWFAFRR
jgi:hypothetical protein